MVKVEIDEDDVAEAARALGCHRSRVRAVVEVETPRGAFDSEDGQVLLFDESGRRSPTGRPRPTILFERHYFHRLTGGRFHQQRVPGIAPPKPGRPPNDYISSPIGGGYGLFSEQHNKLDFAVKLGIRLGYPSTRDAALKSCSWGAFQIMGLYHDEAGHANIQSFVTAMYRGADHHVRAFVEVVKRRKLDVSLREGNWRHFALRWNGVGYEKNRYHIKLEAADKKWSQHYNEEGPPC